MWTAWHAHRLAPDARIVVLESEPVCGRGPSGRNGGFCEGMWTSLASMRDRWGDAPALAVGHAAEAAVGADRGLLRGGDVDAWFRRGGYLQVSTAPATDDVGRAALAACRELGVPDKLRPRLAPPRSRTHCASPEFRAGVIEPITATVQPARLALGLRRRLLEAGVDIYESSPVAPLPRGRRRRRGDDRDRRPGARPAWRPRDRPPPPRRPARRCARGSPSPPPTSSSPSRSPT